MSDAIRTISLDDIGGLGGGTTELASPAYRGYSPQYANANPSQTVPSTLAEPRSAGFQNAQMSRSGLEMTGINAFGADAFDEDRRKYKLIGLGVLMVALILLGVWGASGFGSLDHTIKQLESWLGIESGPEPKIDVTATPKTTPATKQEVTSKPGQELVENNPYWALPNPLDPEARLLPSKGNLTQSQGERWRQALLNPFSWQRYKAVLEIRAARLEGSQFLLTEALTQTKLWTRMEALLGLVELGEPVDLGAVEQGLGESRRPLVENYFRRYNDRNSASEAYILRQSIRLVAAGARLIILEKLAKRRSSTNDLYLYAGSLDPNAKIKAWATARLKTEPVSNDVKKQFEDIAAGRLEDKSENTPSKETNDSSTPVSKSEMTIESVPTDVEVEDVYFLNEED